MPTPFTEVYDFFLSKVTDYSFIHLGHNGDLEDVLFTHLRSSVVRFTTTNTDLSMDLDLQEFNSDLSLDEKEILSTLMVLSYVSGKILNTKHMEQMLSEREYRAYSQANHLKELMSLRSSIQSEISQLSTAYSLKNGLEDFD